MQYKNLNELVRKSRSSADFFYTLSPQMQIKLGERGAYIRTAAELHMAADQVAREEHAIALSESLTPQRREKR